MTEADVANLYLNPRDGLVTGPPESAPLVPDADPNAGFAELAERTITALMRDIATNPGSDAYLYARSALMSRIMRALRDAPKQLTKPGPAAVPPQLIISDEDRIPATEKWNVTMQREPQMDLSNPNGHAGPGASSGFRTEN